MSCSGLANVLSGVAVICGPRGDRHQRGTDTFLDAATVQDFAARLRGSLLRHGDGGYDEARKLFNGMIDHRPALIARCAGAADVIAAVQFVRQHGAVGRPLFEMLSGCSCRPTSSRRRLQAASHHR
jgi:hypothetical protein